MGERFVLGIDLGTSNSAVAFAPADGEEAPEILELAQLTAANALGSQSTLPSATYLPHPGEFSSGLPALPWQSGGEGGEKGLIGQFARNHGALIPDRLVTSAKSWLSNVHVDPRSAVLPWASEIPAEEKASALGVSQGYLEHLRECARLAKDVAIEDGEIVVTVPASFDEVARNLTLEAARGAGLGDVVLLEEPQAAFYAWTAQAGSHWRDQVSPGDVILVCDVGGGTADFSLIAISEREGELALERIAVGEHLLLGGDNMDLALAYTLRAKLEAEGKTLDDWQMLSLTHGCRRAKEELFGRDDLDEAPIAVPSRGAGLFAKTLSVTLDRATLRGVVLDGFFPMTAVTELPQETSRAGLQEFGLPYAADPVVSKHLARFLTRSLQNVQGSEELRSLLGGRADALEGTYVKPSAVLFNGGIFRSAAIRGRVLELLRQWAGGEAPRELTGFEPDLAVARGAAVYGRSRVSGKGLRIKAGTARSYYVGLETSMPAIPGFKPPLKAVCVVPQGMEEGSELELKEREFGLITGSEVDFRFFSSEARSGDEAGTVVGDAERDLEETANLAVELPAREGAAPGELVPVHLQAIVTELGNLELWMQHTGSEQRWQLSFRVRGEE